MIFKSDTVLASNAILWRYNTAKHKLDVFNDVTVIRRGWGHYDYIIAFFSGNSEGVKVSLPKDVCNWNGKYFYIWNNEDIDENEINRLILEAIQKYYNKKIDDLHYKSIKLCSKLSKIESQFDSRVIS